MFRQLSIGQWNKQPTRKWKKWPGVLCSRSHKSKLGVDSLANCSFKPEVIKDGLLYGAMVDHKGGIDHHPTLNQRGPDSNPAAPFLASSTWAMATKGSEIRSQIPPSLKTLGQMMAVRDVGEMAIIDHILAQQDRFGNVAKKKNFLVGANSRWSKASFCKSYEGKQTD